MAVKLLQDIHITDKQFWQTFRTYWKSGNYQSAYNLLQSVQLNAKHADADWFNDLTDNIYNLETINDPTFVKNKPYVGYTPPSGIQTGNIFYEISGIIN